MGGNYDRGGALFLPQSGQFSLKGHWEYGGMPEDHL